MFFSLSLVFITIVKSSLDLCKENVLAIVMDLPNEANFDVVLNCVKLAVVHSRFLSQPVLFTGIIHPYGLFNKLILARQLFGSMAARINYCVVVTLDSWLGRALPSICQDGAADMLE